ncbi:MAG: hypothetical protein Q8R79_07820, partial [Legionellaceae bacterium]|nr:hypothetical protein [Legionellaceae bacterium]
MPRKVEDSSVEELGVESVEMTTFPRFTADEFMVQPLRRYMEEFATSGTGLFTRYETGVKAPNAECMPEFKNFKSQLEAFLKLQHSRTADPTALRTAWKQLCETYGALKKELLPVGRSDLDHCLSGFSFLPALQSMFLAIDLQETQGRMNEPGQVTYT